MFSQISENLSIEPKITTFLVLAAVDGLLVISRTSFELKTEGILSEMKLSLANSESGKELQCTISNESISSRNSIDEEDNEDYTLNMGLHPRNGFQICETDSKGQIRLCSKVCYGERRHELMEACNGILHPYVLRIEELKSYAIYIFGKVFGWKNVTAENLTLRCLIKTNNDTAVTKLNSTEIQRIIENLMWNETTYRNSYFS